MIKVVLSARPGLTRVGISTLLDREPDIRVVQTTEGLDAAVVAFERRRADVLAVSLDHLRAPGPRMSLPSVFITGGTADRAVVDAVSLGARGLVSLEDSQEYVVDAVRAVADGKAFVTPLLATAVLDRLAVQVPRIPTAAAALTRLTDRELAVLRLLAVGRTTSDIAGDLHVTRATVKSHVSHMLLKLGLKERLQAVVLAYASGVVDPATVTVGVLEILPG
jgi:DNA-binding NarL/FixJ family response regulator